jgi:hypothetical protein
VPVDQVTVVLERLGLDLDGVSLDPLIEIAADGDRVPVDVLACASSNPRLVTRGLGVCLALESSDPLGFALASFRVFDPDDV